MRRLLDGERVDSRGRASTRSTTRSASRGRSRPTCRSSSAAPGRRRRCGRSPLRADAWNTSGTVEAVADNDAHPRASTARRSGRDPASIERTVSFPIVIRATRRGGRRAARTSCAGTTASTEIGDVPLLRRPARAIAADAPAVPRARLPPRHRPPAGAVRPRDDRPHRRGPRRPSRTSAVDVGPDPCGSSRSPAASAGRKLASGLQAVVGAELTVVVNTGDDLERHGLLVCPDHDTVMYTLAGLDDRGAGLGHRGETCTRRPSSSSGYGEETWFRLGDRDLATHIVRTARLRAGERLTDVSLGLQRALGVRRHDPADDRRAGPDAGPDRRRLARVPGVLRPPPPGAGRARGPLRRHRPGGGAPPEVRGELGFAEVIVIAPSNPIVSIGPILAVRGMRDSSPRPARARHAGRRGQPDRRRQGAQGSGRPDAGEPRPRVVRARRRPARTPGLVDGFVLDAVDAALAPAVEALGLRTLGDRHAS